MASFTDVIAQCISLKRDEFLAGLSTHPSGDVEHLLMTQMQAHWHPFSRESVEHSSQSRLRVGAVDGSHAVRPLNVGADWIVAQALLLGPDGRRISEGDTLLLRGDVERPAVDRCASLLMRSLELKLALQFVQEEVGNVLLLDGSLYADLPYLLYNLAIGGYEDLPLKVLAQYLDLFELCQQRDVLLLGVAKRTRSKVLGHALLEDSYADRVADTQQTDALPEAEGETLTEEVIGRNRQHPDVFNSGLPWLPSDGELLHRWTEGCGLTDPILLGSASFGHISALRVAQLASRAKQSFTQSESPSMILQDRMQERLSPLQKRLLAAPAIGTFYVRLAPGDDVLRIDALAGAFGRSDLHLLEYAQSMTTHTVALPILQYLLGDYGGLSVYNAALYVVDQEVRLHAETVDRIYLPILRSQLGYPIQYDRSTRRFFS
jgi:hypothetical protein